uniref:Uncharacterized protein n=1 Tax=Mastacembelus armatus TaxID=205130 RepID=A0A3Q3KU62_9TELE
MYTVQTVPCRAPVLQATLSDIQSCILTHCGWLLHLSNMAFRYYVEYWNFVHTSIPPYPQSNGLVEKSQLLTGRSNPPIYENLLKTSEGETVRKVKEQQKIKQKHAGNRMNDKASTWAQNATVKSEVHARSYTIQTEDGTILRRNRRDLLSPVTTDQVTKVDEQHMPEKASFETLDQVQDK